MQKTKKFKCVVTGKETTFTDDYINKKIEQYGSLERFAKLYVSRDVKSQLKRGSKIKDIIRILNIEELTLSDEDITEIEKYYNNSIFRDMSTINEALTAFTYDKSDPDVETFINKYII
jgi:hypothetical protein